MTVVDFIIEHRVVIGIFITFACLFIIGMMGNDR